MPVCVFVNTNTKITGGFLAIPGTRYGHAALGFENSESIDGVNNFYISWYPADDHYEWTYNLNYKRGGKVDAAKAVQHGNASRVAPVTDYWSEPESFKNHCVMVEIPCIGEIATAPGVGLNAKRMEQWWTISKANVMSKFSLISKSKNCASTVMAALWAGGSETYESYSRVVWVSPRDTLIYAQAVKKDIEKTAKLVSETAILMQNHEGANQTLSAADRKKLQKRNDLDTKLANARPAIAGESRGPANTHGKDDLMSLAEWKALSKVEMSWSTGFARRKEQVKNIDKKLEVYERLSWERDYPAKAKLIVEMLQEVRDHMTQKAHSRRANAVMILAGQLITVFKSVADYEVIHKAELDRIRIKEAAAARAAEPPPPPFVLTEHEKTVRKIMILIEGHPDAQRYYDSRLVAALQYNLYRTPKYESHASCLKDQRGNVIVTQGSIDAIPDQLVQGREFDPTREDADAYTYEYKFRFQAPT
jgi:hypothetical protein